MTELATTILAVIAALIKIVVELMAGRMTEDEARAECLAQGRLILPGSAASELEAHEAAAKDASLPGG